MSYLMFCEHKKIKLKLVAWAIYSHFGNEQGFSMKRCCARCGKVVAQ